MNLAEFLKHRRERPASADELHIHIGGFRTAVERLTARIRNVLAPYEDLQVEEQTVLLKEQGVPYGATALTPRFLDLHITVEPKGMSVIGAAGRVEMATGVNVVLLDWNGGDDWSYRWSIPSGDGTLRPLTDAAIEELVQGLLA